MSTQRRPRRSRRRARRTHPPRSMSRATGPESGLPSAADEDDVEGHYFGPNAMVSRSTTQTRERDVQRNLQQHDLKKEARRPFFKKG